MGIIYILLAVIIIELLAIWGAISFKGQPPETNELYREKDTFEDGQTQFVAPESIEEKFEKSEKIDEFINKLDKND